MKELLCSNSHLVVSLLWIISVTLKLSISTSHLWNDMNVFSWMICERENYAYLPWCFRKWQWHSKFCKMIVSFSSQIQWNPYFTLELPYFCRLTCLRLSDDVSNLSMVYLWNPYLPVCYPIYCRFFIPQSGTVGGVIFPIWNDNVRPTLLLLLALCNITFQWLVHDVLTLTFVISACFDLMLSLKLKDEEDYFGWTWKRKLELL